MMRMPTLVTLCAAVAGFVWLGCAPSGEDPARRTGLDEEARIEDTTGELPPTPFEIGSPFPLVALRPADGGSPVTIADFRGTKIVLHVFASW